IHGAGRLNRHPCRFTPQINIEFRPAWFDGAPKIKSKIKIKIKSGSLRIVVTVDCYKLQRCVDTHAHRRQAGSYGYTHLP
ncbi:hypothetical protein, partial [Pseudomonas pergaminensis]